MVKKGKKSHSVQSTDAPEDQVKTFMQALEEAQKKIAERKAADASAALSAAKAEHKGSASGMNAKASQEVSNAGWHTVSHQKKTVQESSDVSSEVLMQEGWSVQVLEMEKMSVAAEGVCTASQSDALALVSELSHAKVPLAVVTEHAVSEESTSLQVRMQLPDGKAVMRHRHLTKIGSAGAVVSYDLQVKCVRPSSKSCVVVLYVWQKWMDPKDWNSAVERPRAFVGRWLDSACGAKPLDIFRPTMTESKGGDKGIRLLVRLPLSQFVKVMSTSGVQSVFSRPIVAVESDRLQHRMIWLTEASVESALRQAGHIDCSVGLVANERGLGIRVPVNSFAECAGTLLGESAAVNLAGDLWELVGVPLDWTEESVADVFLKLSWAATVVRPVYKGKSRTWVVRFAQGQSPDQPVLKTEEEGVLITVQKAGAPPRKPAKQVWSWGGRSAEKAEVAATSRWSQGPPRVHTPPGVTTRGTAAAAVPSQAPAIVQTNFATMSQGPDAQQTNPLEAIAQCLASIQANQEALKSEFAELKINQETLAMQQHTTDKDMRSLKLALDPPEDADFDVSDADLEEPGNKSRKMDSTRG